MILQEAKDLIPMLPVNFGNNLQEVIHMLNKSKLMKFVEQYNKDKTF